ncbi:MAG: integration host factor subunit alpha [Myxococcota bacterium]
MTKADIIEAVYEKLREQGSYSKRDAAEIVESVFETMKDTLGDGEKIKISGFGNFVVRQKKARVGRNPQTGEQIMISARKVLTFKPSQVLKNALNENGADA